MRRNSSIVFTDLTYILGRMLSPGASRQVDMFMKSVQEHRDSLTLSLTLHNALVASRTSEKIDTMCAYWNDLTIISISHL